MSVLAEIMRWLFVMSMWATVGSLVAAGLYNVVMGVLHHRQTMKNLKAQDAETDQKWFSYLRRYKKETRK